jgi:rhodanese-related sulfurtransferase
MSKLYAGDITPNDAWEILKSDSGAMLIDVRTTAEWHFVGTPDLASLNKKTILLEIRSLPNMDKNPNFEKTVTKVVQDQNTKIIFLCRTGGRSAEAATEMSKLGYSQCYNIAGGFEGELDTHSHRNKISGWKASQLPWKQD